MTEEIIDNIARVRENIAQAAQKSGRAADEIILVAATKMNSAARVKIAIQNGIDAAGENRVQELLEKFEANAYHGKPLHFIGTLQTNKVKYLIGKVQLIQSVSSIKLAQCIAREACKKNMVQDVLLEVNIGREESKSGFAPEQLDEAIGEIRQEKGILIRGLMAIPPVAQENHKNQVYFEEMRKLFVDISPKRYDNVYMDFLSMGMSNDYMSAIACGSNMVRVGRSIFGERRY